MNKALEESQLSTEVISYKALETAMLDGKIVEDDNLFFHPRKTLGISDSLHDELFTSLSNNQ